MTIERIHVVSAAIIRSNRILLAQRSPDTSFPWAWCAAGGKVEPGEDIFDTLRRELREELGVELQDTTKLMTAFGALLDPPVVRYPIRVICARVEWGRLAGTPIAGDKTIGLGWFSAAELAGLELAPADNVGRQQLIRLLEKSAA